MFSLRKTSNYIHKYSQIAFASDRVANAKKGARTSLFHRSPHLFSSSYSLLLSSASTDADARIGRRGCSYRPTRMLVSTDADARNDRRGCSYRPTRMTFVDVSQCQTFTFVLPNLYFRSAKLLLSCSQIVTFVAQNLSFYISHSLFLSISSSVFLDQ